MGHCSYSSDLMMNPSQFMLNEDAYFIDITIEGTQPDKKKLETNT